MGFMSPKVTETSDGESPEWDITLRSSRAFRGVRRAVCRARPICGSAWSPRTARGLLVGAMLSQDAAQPFPLPGSHDVTRARRRAAAARMQKPLVQRKTVIERQLLALGDVAPRNNPDPSADRLRFAVGRARVIDQARGIPAGSPVEIIASIQRENVHARVVTPLRPAQPRLFASHRFGLRDALTGVFDYPRSRRNQSRGIHAPAVYRRSGDAYPWVVRAYRPFCHPRTDGADRRPGNPLPRIVTPAVFPPSISSRASPWLRWLGHA